MSEQSTLRLWLMRAGFVLLAMITLFFQLLPLNTAPIDLFTPDLVPLGDEADADARLDALLSERAPSRWVAPNVLLGFALAWAVRRPEFVPSVLIAGLLLLSDFLLGRPPGLWAAIAFVGIEAFRARGRILRDSTFPAEWLSASLILIAIMLGNRIALALTLVPLPPLGLTLFELGMTIVFYPVFAAASHWLMGVRKAQPGDLDATGQRI